MEEKRKLEKLLLTDIDAALAQLNMRRQHEREPIALQAVVEPPADVRALFDQRLSALEEVDRTKSELETLGYSTSGYGKDSYLTIAYRTQPKVLAEFDAATDKMKNALAELKRTYTLKLFAGGEEARELFASLAQELANIVR